MGFCFSCCRRQRKSHDPERDPLLPPGSRKHADADVLPPPTNSLQKISDVLGALKANKLPSQDQLDKALEAVLSSDGLDVRGVGGYGPVGKDARKVVLDMRECVEALLEFGLQKNGDDRLQDLWYQLSRVDSKSITVDAEVQVNEDVLVDIQDKVTPPSSAELSSDMSTLLSSIKQILTLLLTSSFRLILSSLFSTTRELISSTAGAVEAVAGRVEEGARGVERAVGGGDLTFSETRERVGEAANDAFEAGLDELGGVGQKGVDRAREDIIGRIEETITLAHKNSKYRSALQQALFILRKYTTKISKATTSIPSAATSSSSQAPPIIIEPTIEVDTHLTEALGDIKALLERCSGGRSLDPLFGAFESFFKDISSAPDDMRSELRALFDDLGRWFDNALASVDHIRSRAGRKEAERIYERIRVLLIDSQSEWGKDLRAFGRLVDEFVNDGLGKDHTLRRMVEALSALETHLLILRTSALGSTLRAQRKRREEVFRDLAAWILPKILKIIKGVPMPRVEYADSSVEVAVDALLLSGGTGLGVGLVPDRVVVQNWSEVVVDMVPEHGGAHEGGTSARSKVRVRVDGLRVQARDVGYYLRWKGLGGLLGYSDEGLVSLLVGKEGKVGEGLSLDIELETSSDAWFTSTAYTEDNNDNEPLFKVLSTTVSFPGLALTLNKSKHWLLNKLLIQPVASGVAVRAGVGWLVQGYVKSGLEALEERLRGVVRGASAAAAGKEEEPGLVDYWGALMDSFTEEEDKALDSEEPEIQVESHIKPTAKGIIRTTKTQVDPDPKNSSSPPSAMETAFAIGLGPQLFPHKGGAYHEPPPPPPTVVAREALDDVEEVVQGTAQGVNERLGKAIEVREELEGAEERYEQRVQAETVVDGNGRVMKRGRGRGRAGWRSEAFSI